MQLITCKYAIDYLTTSGELVSGFKHTLLMERMEFTAKIGEDFRFQIEDAITKYGYV